MIGYELLLETSHNAHCAITFKGEIVESTKVDNGRRHHRDLVPTLQQILANVGIKPDQLQKIIVGIGPGSYTGLRVGIMIAKTMSYAIGCPLIAVPTYQIIASQIPANHGTVAVIGDALKGTAYVQEYGQVQAQGIRLPEQPLRIELFETWLNQQHSANRSHLLLTGPGIAVFQDQITRLHPNVSIQFDPSWSQVDMSAMHRCSLATSSLDDAAIMALEPLYLRGSSAEEKLKQNIS